MCAPQRPLHLLLLHEPSAHYLVDCRFNERRADRFLSLPTEKGTVVDTLAILKVGAIKVIVRNECAHARGFGEGQAAAQGQQEAINAIAAAQTLWPGLGSVIYYKMELRRLRQHLHVDLL